MTINEMVKAAHEQAVRSGWWGDGEVNPLQIHALIHTEVSEATEEARKGTPPVYVINHDGRPAEIEKISSESFTMRDGESCTPIKLEGQLIELADVLIRVADYCGKMGWDLEAAVKAKMEYNATRPHRHGNKKY